MPWYYEFDDNLSVGSGKNEQNFCITNVVGGHVEDQKNFKKRI